MATPSLRSAHAERQAAAVVLARFAARRRAQHPIPRLVKLYSLSAATLSRLANEDLRQHPKLLVETAASPIGQRPGNQALPLCKSHVQNSAQRGGQ
jgi:hypothetical protein